MILGHRHSRISRVSYASCRSFSGISKGKENEIVKKLFALIITVVMLVSASAAFAEALSVAVIYSDTVDDKGWCQAMDDGIKAVIAAGNEIEYTSVESVAIPDAQSVLDQMAGEYDVIIVHGAQFTAACLETAAKYPEQTFVLGTTDQILGDNIFSFMPQSEEPGYVNGVMAGMITKVNKVGIVGSTDNGDSARYVRGFVLGLQASNPNCEYMLSWTNSFSDSVGAGDIARAFIEAGCDVLVGAAQQAVGAIRAAETAGNVAYLGQTIYQMTDFPCTVIAAADYDYSAVLLEVMAQMNNGVTGGVCIPMNYNNNSFAFNFSESIDEDAKTAAIAVLEALTAAPNTVDYVTALD